MKTKQKSEKKSKFRIELEKEKDKYSTIDEREAFLDGVSWMIDNREFS